MTLTQTTPWEWGASWQSLMLSCCACCGRESITPMLPPSLRYYWLMLEDSSFLMKKDYPFKEKCLLLEKNYSLLFLMNPASFMIYFCVLAMVP